MTFPTLHMIALAPRNMQWPLAQYGSSCGGMSDILIFHLLIARDDREEETAQHISDGRSYISSAPS
jgi:hypothetical protein